MRGHCAVCGKAENWWGAFGEGLCGGCYDWVHTIFPGMVLTPVVREWVVGGGPGGVRTSIDQARPKEWNEANRRVRERHVCGLQGFGAPGDVCQACRP